MLTTLSLCPTCYKKIPAEIHFTDGVVMVKECDVHGQFIGLVENDRTQDIDTRVARCLAAIGSQPGQLTVMQLAFEANLDKAQVSRTTKLLVERGLVSKLPCPEDGRCVQLTLTAEGRRCCEQVMPLIQQRNQELLQCLNETEQTALLDMFDRMLEQARQQIGGARLLLVERRGLSAFHASLVFRGGRTEEPAAAAGVTVSAASAGSYGPQAGTATATAPVAGASSRTCTVAT